MKGNLFRQDCYIRTAFEVIIGMFPLMAIGLTFNEVMLTVGIAVAGVTALALLVRMALLSRTGEIKESAFCRYVDDVMVLAYPFVITYIILHEWGLLSEPLLCLAGGICLLLLVKDDYPF